MTAPLYTVHLRQSESEPPTVVLAGELDLASCPQLQTCFERALGTGASVLDVDLAEVSFIDSAALQVLVDAYRELRDRHGRLVVTAASTFVIRTLELTGLAPYFLPDVPGGPAATPN